MIEGLCGLLHAPEAIVEVLVITHLALSRGRPRESERKDGWFEWLR